MAIILLFLAALLVYLWYRVREFSAFTIKFENCTAQMRQQIAGIERKLAELQEGFQSQTEAVQEKRTVAKPAPSDAQPAAQSFAPQPPPVPGEVPPKTAATITTPKPEVPMTAPKLQPTTASARTEQPKPPVFHPPAPPSRSWQLPKFDWESLVGVKLFSWIAGIALLLAAIFFLKYSKDQGWLTPPVQMAVGILVGMGLLVLCELKAARKYPVTANAMDASAIAILFSTFFSAHVLWNLVGSIPAFGLLILTTTVAVLLSIRRNSLFIALLGLVGGFATPILLSTGENKPIQLFTYLILLNVGLAWVAAKKKWPLLTTISLIFTVLYQWGWVMKFLTEAQLPIAVGIFLIFPILAFIGLLFARKEDPAKGWASLYGQTANLSALLPLLFVLYTAAVPAYGQRYLLLFGFLFLLDLGLFAIAAARGPEIMHAFGGLATLLTFAIWMGFSYESPAWPTILGILAVFALFYLASPVISRRYKRPFADMGMTAAYVTPLLLFAFPFLAGMEPACSALWPLLGTLLLILLGASAYAIYFEEGAVYYIAAAFALLTEAVWSINYLTPERLFHGLALYAIMALFFIGVPLAAGRMGKRLRPEGAGTGLLLASLALLFFLAAGPVASASIWGLALLLLIINAGLFWQGATYRIPGLALAGMVLSWIIMGVLWASASLAAILIPALVVMAGFALLVLAGNIWIQKKAAGVEPTLMGNGLYLGLAGHLFLFPIAAQQSLTLNPWPFLGILLILCLAVGYASLYIRRSDLHLSSLVLSALLLTVWVTTAAVAPWPATAIVAAGILAAIAFGWIYLARRSGMEIAPFSNAAAITVLLAQAVAIMASTQPGSPGLGFLLAAHLVFLLALMTLGWFRKNFMFIVVAILPTAIAVAAWSAQHFDASYWQELLLFAIPTYLVFIGYPLLLGRRCGQSLAPYLAAVLAGIPFFFEARHAILQAGWGNAIGILPVIQALLMALLLIRLLGIEAPGLRALGRLALVAGAGLAFITVAIPLQLDKNWITIGWAMEGLALSWLFCKIPHKGLLYALSALFTAVFVRLAMNPYIFHYQPRSEMRIWNWYLYTYLTSAAAMILGGWLLSKIQNALFAIWTRISKLFIAAGILLLFLLLNIEIADFYSTGASITFRFTATLAQDLTYTLGWALFAVALLACGIALRNHPARIASLALLVVTILKCFMHDLTRLGGLYQVASFVGLAICLALVALALQKFVLSARKEAK